MLVMNVAVWSVDVGGVAVVDVRAYPEVSGQYLILCEAMNAKE